MNRLSIYILALGAFLTATSELVVSGILYVIAEDLHISLALAGQLITAYSLAFAIGTPILVALTSRLERKKVLVASLLLFMIGCVISSLSSNIALFMVSRVITGIASGVYLVVTFGIAAKIVPPHKLGSAIGTIVFGFSSALILGVPMGIAITNWLSWQAIFIILCLLSLIIALIIFRLLPTIEGSVPVSFRQQFQVLGSSVIVFGLLLTLFRESGGSVFVTYLTPFLQDHLRIHAANVSIVMLVLGIVGAIGSRAGGYGIDRWGAAKVIVLGMIVQIAALALLPLLTEVPLIGLMLVGFVMLSMFTVGPAIQSYFIQQAPRSSDLVLSLNTSTTHLGLAIGAGTGGLMADTASTLLYHPLAAGFIVALGLGAGLIGFAVGNKRLQATTSSLR
ncbi:MFS transporter [Paenibacillus sp. MSJ-34]|uniref:MFS transporter n=1 Tax=Paenibacillus sp. MSJ-34 TaxID=2841529 RepID=UPI001C103135|nr:MFS transporter [Paenibacillus sp. MSJ-34]MBU5443664.1 MFS transporter [Paenibacillus sp. MSJ-34]